MSDSLVHLTRRPDGLVILTLSRPPVNALDLPTLKSLVAALDAVREQLPRALVIAGRPGCFSAGIDLKAVLLRFGNGASVLGANLPKADDGNGWHGCVLDAGAIRYHRLAGKRALQQPHKGVGKWRMRPNLP